MTKEELKKRRENLGLTQAELSDLVGKSSNTVSRYETGLMEIPKWMDYVLHSLETEHIKTLQNSRGGSVVES